MAALRSRLLGRLRSDAGYTLPELLIGLVIAGTVGAAALGLISMAVQAQPKATEKSAQIQEGRTMIERMAREMRQGESILNPTASSFSVLTYVNSATCGGATASAAIFCRVTYSCGSTSCTRTEANADGSGTGSTTTAVSGISGPNVFSYAGAAADPSYVGVKLVFPREEGGEAITLEDGAGLRNYFTSEGPAM